MLSLEHPIGERYFGLRLDTLIRLRWLAIAGQTLTIVIVHWLLAFTLPIGACLAVVALSAWLNLALRLRNPGARRLSDIEAAWLLAYDILQLAALLFLTGGLSNPFAFLFLAPVLISATALSPRTTVLLGVLAASCAAVVGLWQMPLPWSDQVALGNEPELPAVYLAAIWCALAISIAFIGVHAWRVAEETRELSEALAATELVLAREQHLSALDGLAAAAAHELGTPLATITVVAKELVRALPADSPMVDDIGLLREQAERCRTILRTLTSLGGGEAPFDRMPISHILEDVVAPHRNFGIAIEVTLPDRGGDEPIIARNPGLLYGLGNIVENAVDFANGRVDIVANWTDAELSVTVTDDGPGFPPELIDSIGAPYVTSRGRHRWRRDMEPEGEALVGDGLRVSEGLREGLGLGVFIAKTLLERSGAELSFLNRALPAHGASVSVRWPRRAIDISGEGHDRHGA
ncbi:ActS/PrrB/RegB family redox-sensitive histidine kinase [Ancylobacter sp. MQZ15Z-1]|uniref:histidine kinase n=1 Tax=Ancylobacter mangrovi TaxID=2972472 RepID=A0A9X2PGE0_9HYPH|nr:ActS/PrrB/RegB family redox-sensitive histidine kinase [Ancylobacter mangrovi]MCS0494957.1 ActS/PrrB/RegB family redox-sensitive histidine kinase [Ancylobacter mangrovi]